MKNKELIELLSKFDPEIEICYLDEKYVTEVNFLYVVSAVNEADWSDWQEDEGGNVLLIQ